MAYPRCMLVPSLHLDFGVIWPSLPPLLSLCVRAQSLAVVCLSYGRLPPPGAPPGSRSSLSPESACSKVLSDYLATLLKSPHNPHATSHVELAHARMLCILGVMTPLWVLGCWGGVLCEHVLLQADGPAWLCWAVSQRC